MSAKSTYKPWAHKIRARQEALKKQVNHVNETDLSPGGFPFHFKGPTKKKK